MIEINKEGVVVKDLFEFISSKCFSSELRLLFTGAPLPQTTAVPIQIPIKIEETKETEPTDEEDDEGGLLDERFGPNLAKSLLG